MAHERRVRGQLYPRGSLKTQSCQIYTFGTTCKFMRDRQDTNLSNLGLLVHWKPKSPRTLILTSTTNSRVAIQEYRFKGQHCPGDIEPLRQDPSKKNLRQIWDTPANISFLQLSVLPLGEQRWTRWEGGSQTMNDFSKCISSLIWWVPVFQSSTGAFPC